MENNEKLAMRGKQGGLRGVKKRSDPNKYPLRVICGDCGQPMSGTQVGARRTLDTQVGGLGKERRFICSTYSNSGGDDCYYNWVERDVVTWYAIHSIQRLVKDFGQEDALRTAIREIVEKRRSLNRDADSKVAEKRAKIVDLDRQLKETYEDKIRSTGVEKQLATELHLELLAKRKLLSRELEAVELATSPTRFDLEDEVKRMMAVLGDLHLFLEQIPENRLRETFDALGLELTVQFEHRRKGNRRQTRANVPTGVELKIGRNNRLRVPAGVAETPHEEVPVCYRTILGIDSRGDWI